MKPSRDISSLLKEWKYQEIHEEKNVRRLRASNGREILQVRRPLGIEQYEIHGRPDGLKPEGAESWFDHYLQQAKVFQREFVLDKTAFERLANESNLYYNRYLIFFQIQEFEWCIRDLTRNLKLLSFVKKYASDSEHSSTLEQYRPYLLRMLTMAKALGRIKESSDLRGALRILNRGLEELHQLPDMPGNEVFQFERARSLHSFEELISQLENQLPPSMEDIIKKKMTEAVEKEDYELAAKLRDRLQSIVKPRKKARKSTRSS